MARSLSERGGGLPAVEVRTQRYFLFNGLFIISSSRKVVFLLYKNMLTLTKCPENSMFEFEKLYNVYTCVQENLPQHTVYIQHTVLLQNI